MSDEELDSASCGKAAGREAAKLEEQLRRSEESLRLMVESATDYAIVMLDPQGRVVSWNSGAQRIMGYGAQEIVGAHFSRFYPGPDIARGAPQRDLGIAATMGRFEHEGFRVRNDGSVFWAHVVCKAIRDQVGILRGFAKLTRDLTERRKVEAELTTAKLVAEVASLAKTDFLSSMSHELRTPLNAILGFAQLLDSDAPQPTPRQKESIARILQAGGCLMDLINEVLDLALIESGRVSWSLEPVSLTEVMLECQTRIEPQAQKRGVCVRFPKIDTPCFVTADRTRVKQVIINLLSNVIRYNQSGGSVLVECKASAPQRLRVSVRDTGAGLAAQELARLFQPFHRLGQEAGSGQGTGIGLVVSKRLVELMGGAIGVESTVGEGSVFWIELVVAAAPHPVAVEAELFVLTQAPIQDQVVPRTLLYVEDNPANLQRVEQIISRRPGMRLLSFWRHWTWRWSSRKRKPARAARDRLLMWDGALTSAWKSAIMRGLP